MSNNDKYASKFCSKITGTFVITISKPFSIMFRKILSALPVPNKLLSNMKMDDSSKLKIETKKL